MIQLRPYQLDGFNEIYKRFASGQKHVIFCAPTGSGKTVVFSYICQKVAAKGKKALIFTNRTELLLQASGSINKFGLNTFLIQAGGKYVSNSFNIFVAMSQTFRRRYEQNYWIEFMKTIDIVIIDECHLQEFNYLFESGLLDDKYVIGFTATPKRGGKQRQLGLDYESIVESISIKELIKQGYLVNNDNYDIAGPDVSNVAYDHMKGDFQEKAMFKQFNSPKLYSGTVKNYLTLANNTKTIVFCVNIEHTIRTYLEFVKNRIDARFIVSNVSKPKTGGQIERYEDRMMVYELYQEHCIWSREEVLEWFKKSKNGVLVNASILTTGFDEPSIQTVILNRATLSLQLFLQMIGRGSRINVDKTHFNILDFGGNLNRHGDYSEKRLWSVWHEESKGGGIPPVKECGFDSEGKPITSNKIGCRRLILAMYTICPFCGFKYPEKKLEEVELTLKTPTATGKKIKDMTAGELYEYWKYKGHKPAWLWRQLWYKGRESAIYKFGRQHNWKPATINKAIIFCKSF